MGAICVIVPILAGSAWPAVTTAATAALGAMGYTLVANKTKQTENQVVHRAEIPLQNSQSIESLSSLQTGTTELVLEREGIRARFARNAQGEIKFCLESSTLAKAQLEKLGQEMLGRVTQQYVYHRLVTECKEHHLSIVAEEVQADQSVKLRIRQL